jgi:hypothetical protein
MIVILFQKEEANATSLNWSKDARSGNVLAVTGNVVRAAADICHSNEAATIAAYQSSAIIGA